MTEGTSGTGAATSTALTSRQWITLIVLTLSTLIVLLDGSVVFIALPKILQDLGGTLDQGSWVLAGFILSFVVFLLVFGKLGDLFGRRRLFVLGITLFTLASLACALAPSMPFLIGARVVQGIGAAMVEPTVLALIRSTFPPERLGLAFGVQGSAAGIGASLGPILGGAITTGLSWPYIFLINVPIGLIAIIGALLTLPESRSETAAWRPDIPGLLLSAAGLFCLVFALVEGERLGWRSSIITGAFVAAAVLLVLFVIAERHAREPLVDLALFSDRLFAVGNLLRAITEFGGLGVFFVVALFLEYVLGYSPLRSGLVLLPLVLAAIVVSPLAGKLSDRVDVRWLVVPAFLLVAGGLFWLAHLSPQTGWAFFVAPLVIAGAGLAALYGPTTSTTLSKVPAAQTGLASSVSYAAFLIGSELGVAVVSGVLQSAAAANARTALADADVPPSVSDRVIASISAGTLGGPSPADSGGADAAAIAPLIANAFASAVNTALVSCAAAAVVGAVVGLFFASGRRDAAPIAVRDGG